MIAIDTNVLLRVLLDDDAEQARRARALLTEHASPERPAFFNRVVLCEALWTLVSGYRYSRRQVADAVELLLAAPALRLEDDAAVEEALGRFRDGSTGFADTLIAVLNRRVGCATTYTFDRRAAATAGFTRLA